MSALHIEGRRWFQRGPGNTYHSARVFHNGQEIAHVGYRYGYGQQYLCSAYEALKAAGHTKAAKYVDWLKESRERGDSDSCIDVQRKKDL